MSRAADRYAEWVGSERYRAERPGRARVIAHLCRRELGEARRIADLGAGTGLIKKTLEEETGKPIVGFEIDVPFIRDRSRMAAADVLRLPVANGALDFVIANHLYEHVDDPAALFREMYRALRPGGLAYVTAGNRLAVMEPHYRLPFLSWLPRRAAGAYVRLAGKGSGYEGIAFLTRGPLTRAMRAAGFRVRDDTRRALDELLAERWGEGWARAWGAARLLPETLLGGLLRRLSPQWFFLLEKPAAGRGGEGRGEEGRTAGAGTGESADRG